MDEVRYWTSMNVMYRPGLPLIFGSFWITLVGLVLNLVLKVGNPVRKEGGFDFRLTDLSRQKDFL
jgi:hypothetical protein